MKDIFNWIYSHNGYDMWNYKSGEVKFTQSFIMFGKEKQRELDDEFIKLITGQCGEFNIHYDCE